jgi:ribosomal protein S17
MYPNKSLDTLEFICGVKTLAAVFEVIHRVGDSVRSETCRRKSKSITSYVQQLAK